MECLQKTCGNYRVSPEQSGSSSLHLWRQLSRRLMSLHWLPVVQRIHLQDRDANASSANDRTTTVPIRTIAAQNVASYNSVDQHEATCRLRPSFVIYTRHSILQHLPFRTHYRSSLEGDYHPLVLRRDSRLFCSTTLIVTRLEVGASESSGGLTPYK